VLFNLDKAKTAIRQTDFAVLVEGQMDCIRAYMNGVQPVIATSGTAFTEAQVRLLGRFTKRVVVNFDPDTAGANAAEKSLSLLTEEEFEVKIVTLEDGLDPDRYIRERGTEAYLAALRGARPHADYLIDRARRLYPQATPDAKVKAVNFLLPHIRRLPNAIQRDAFVNDAAQKLNIDGALLKQEVRKAAASRIESIRTLRMPEADMNERALIQALVRPAGDAAREHAAVEIGTHPEWVEGLATGSLLESLAQMPAGVTPLDAAANEHERATVAKVLQEETSEEGDALLLKVHGALHTLYKRWIERRRRELRDLIAEAERQGDRAALEMLQNEDLALSRTLRTL
jgi:DNA primase